MTNEQVDAAIAAHYKWISRLTLAVETGESEFTPALVGSDNNCELGQWIYSMIHHEGASSSPKLVAVKVLHAKFHECAALVLQRSCTGRQDEARAMMLPESEFKMISRALILLLMDMKK